MGFICNHGYILSECQECLTIDIEIENMKNGGYDFDEVDQDMSDYYLDLDERELREAENY